MAITNPFKDLTPTQRNLAIGGSALVAGYLVISHHSKTGSWNPFGASPATGSGSGGQATSIDPVTGLAYSQDNVTDPLTGETYLAEANQYGSVQAAESAVSAYGQSTASGSGIPVNPASPQPSGTPNTPVGSNVYTSNQAWAQAATAGLADIGYNETDVATALGDYLTQTPVTAAQKSLIDTAIAEYGPAPVGNLQIILVPTQHPGNTMVTVPDEIGSSQEDAFKHVAELGLKARGTPVKPGKVLYVKSQSPKAGTQVTKGSTVVFTSVISPPNKQP